MQPFAKEFRPIKKLEPLNSPEIIYMFLSLLLLLPSLQAVAADSFFEVHEWGTFTSFQQSEGLPLYGLQRGDEPLPGFVYLRNPTLAEPSHGTAGCHRNSYSCDWAPSYLPEPIAHY